MIVRVNAVLNRTVIDVSTTCAVVIFTVKVSCITSVDGTKLWLLIVCQSGRDVIGYDDSYCHW